MTDDPKLEWAMAVIEADREPDNIGMAAHIVLAAFERQRAGEFICDRCHLRQNATPDLSAPIF